MNLKLQGLWAGPIRVWLLLISIALLVSIKFYNPPSYISSTPLLVSFPALLLLDLAALLFGSIMVAECIRMMFQRQTRAWTPKAHTLVVLSLLAIQIVPHYFWLFPIKSKRYYNFAWELIERKDFEPARKGLDIAIAYDHRNVSALAERGFVHKKLGAFGEALRDYTQASAIDPTNALVYEGIGQVYYSTGDYKNALQQFRKALSLDPARSSNLEKWIKSAEKGAANQAL